MSVKKVNGIIVNSVGGIYTVDVSENSSEHNCIPCKARGVFRKRSLVPLCADRVTVEMSDDGSNVITEILPRTSCLIRPAVANLDCLVLVNSVAEPEPDLLILDKFIAVSVYKNILPVVVFTKIDKGDFSEYAEIYRKAGITVFCVDNTAADGADELKSFLTGKISAFTGNTGVGKSSLLNNMFPHLSLEINEISKKLGRGKHTTRQVSLFPVEGGGYIADTPGFSTFETNKYDIIFKEKLAGCFTEFEPFTDKCRFPDCSHTKETGCAVISAVNDGAISKSRFESYKIMYEEAKQLKEWEYKL